MGQFMKPIPLNVPVGLAVSLFVAYVFAPFLARKFLNFKKIKKEVLAHHAHDADEGSKEKEEEEGTETPKGEER